MAATFVSSAAHTGNPTTSCPITIPTVQVNDLLIASFTNGGATTAPTVTDNDGGTWNKKTAGTTKGTVWWRRATSATSAKVVTAAGMTNSSSGTLFVIRGAITSGDPFHLFTEEENIAGNETHAQITTTVAGCYVGFCIANGATNGDSAGVASVAGATIGSLSNFQNANSTGGVDCANSQAGVAQAAAGATGAITWTQADLATTTSLYAVTPQPATQDLTPSLFTNSQTFFTQTVGVGAVDLAPSLFTNAQTFYTQTVDQPVLSQDLTPDLFSNAQTFYTQTITVGAVDLAPSLFANSQTFFTQTVATGAVDLAPDLFVNAQTFYTQTVEAEGGTQDLTPDLFANDQTFYEQVVTSTYGLTAEHFANDQTFYTQTVELGEAPPVEEEESTGGASYIPGLVEGYRARKERRRKAEERLWETARETYRQLHGIAREAPEALPEAIQEEIKELVAPAVKARAAKRAQATLPAPSTINWNAVAAHLSSVERLTVILEQIERARQEDEDDDEDFLFMAA
jgi:hypothetical protein